MAKNNTENNNNEDTILDVIPGWESLAQVLHQHAIISVTDAAGVILYVNEMFCQVSGYTEEELLGQNHRIIKSDRHNAGFYQTIWRTISSGKLWKGEICNRRKDGSEYWVASTIAPILNELGTPRQYVSVRTDVTQQKQVQLDHDEQAEALQQAQELAKLVSWRVNPGTGQFKSSDNLYEIYGLDPNDGSVNLQTLSDMVYPPDKHIEDKIGEDLRETGRYSGTLRIVRPDGVIRYVHAMGQGNWDNDGNLTQVSGAIQDISDRVALEQQLQETEKHFQLAVKGAGAGVWSSNLGNQTVDLSATSLAMLGYSEEDQRWPLDSLKAIIHADDKPGLEEAVRSHLAGETEGYDIQMRMRCFDGSYKWILSRGAIVARDENGMPLKTIGINSDISELKRKEQALIEARNEADHANQAKSVFLSNMSHELRTPMNAILGFGQLLELDDDLSKTNAEYVHEILKAGGHLLELINEVLDLAKVESGKVVLSIEPVNLHLLLEDIATLIRPMAEAAAINLDLLSIPSELVVMADKVRLKQVLINLLSNAVKYNRQHGGIYVTATVCKGYRIKISVEDTGIGIDEEDLKNIFSPFNRLAAEGTVIEGTGIGLTITKKLVEKMGGQIGVQSRVGKGSRFWVEFPQAEDVVGSFEHIAEEDVRELLSSHAGENTILYIDDNPSNLKLVKNILQAIPGVRFLDAHTPHLGLHLAKVNLPDLILLDINMPGMDGHEVLGILKALPGFSATRIVAVSANAMPSDIARAKRAGFDDYISKPFDVRHFLTVVREQIELAQDS